MRLNSCACFKNVENPSCFDLVLTNPPDNFQSTCVVYTGLPDFHKMNEDIFRKMKPKYLNYRKYKSFSNERSTEDLVSELSKENFNRNMLKCF